MSNVRAGYFLVILLLVWSNRIVAQGRPQPESGQFWDKRGQQLMGSGQFARAYSAFQLARSLGASGMVPRMKEARRRNINHILLQGLMAEARGLAETDPVQGLRLLEYANKNFPDSNRIVQMFGDIINRPNLWLYSLKGAAIWLSPQGLYMIANTQPARLYACRSDSLAVRYTFKEPVHNVFFSPDAHFVWVITSTRSVLLDCGKQSVREVSQQELNIEAATFSADSRYVFLRKSGESVAKLWRIQSGALVPTVITHQNHLGEPLFSPDSRYVYVNTLEGTETTGQLWHLSDDQPNLLRRFTGLDAVAQVVFDVHSHWLLGAGREPNTLLLADLQTDSVRTVRRFVSCHADRLAMAFSPGGDWLLLSFLRPDVDSLWALAKHSLRPRYAFQPEPGPSGGSVRVLSRFSPDGSWLLRSTPNELTQAQCWNLHSPVPTMVHRFQQKTNVVNDVFSADSRYLLSRHTGSIRDSLWRFNTTGPAPVHGFRTLLRTVGNDDDTKPLTCFSADSRYLVTYHAGAVPDSLWSLDESGLEPLHGFSERLSVQHSRFSTDTRWFVGGSEERTGATLYNLSLLRAMQRPKVNYAFTDARFSASGTYLLGRTTATDSATVLYQIEAGQLRLIQKLSQPFLIDECRFLANDRFLFTYHEIGGASARRRFANYIWHLTNTGIRPLMLLTEPAVRVVDAMSGQFQFAPQSINVAATSGRSQFVSRGIVTSADDQYMLAHPVSDQPDSLWWLSDRVHSIRDFKQRAAYRTIQPSAGKPNRVLTVPEVGFVGNYLWSRSALDSSISLYRLWENRQTQVMLPKGTATLLGYSPITNYGVFCFLGRLKAPELWHYHARHWHFVQKLPMISQDLNWNWAEKPFANLISPDGQLLIIPTNNNHLLLYRLSSQKPVLLTNQIAQVRRFSFLETQTAQTRTTGVVYSDTQQTHLLRLGQSTCLHTIVGEGTLQLLPVCRSGQLYLVRRLGDGQTGIDVLSQKTGLRLAGTIVRQFLDMTILPTGMVWVMTGSGLHILYTPTERLVWLRRAIIAPLSPELQRNYVFN
ncbi:WD40 repeat domain-containing protein [Spirosoma jeollabukense]